MGIFPRSSTPSIASSALPSLVSTSSSPSFALSFPSALGITSWQGCPPPPKPPSHSLSLSNLFCKCHLLPLCRTPRHPPPCPPLPPHHYPRLLPPSPLLDFLLLVCASPPPPPCPARPGLSSLTSTPPPPSCWMSPETSSTTLSVQMAACFALRQLKI